MIAFLVLSGLALVRLYRAQEQYRATLAEQENLAAMGRMTAGIAHEIRNPLSVIRGTGPAPARVASQSAGIDDPMADFIPEEIDRLDRILSSYLSFGSDGGDGEPEQLDLADVVERTSELMADDLDAAGIALELELGGTHGDRGSTPLAAGPDEPDPERARRDAGRRPDHDPRRAPRGHRRS